MQCSPSLICSSLYHHIPDTPMDIPSSWTRDWKNILQRRSIRCTFHVCWHKISDASPHGHEPIDADSVETLPIHQWHASVLVPPFASLHRDAAICKIDRPAGRLAACIVGFVCIHLSVPSLHIRGAYLYIVGNLEHWGIERQSCPRRLANIPFWHSEWVLVRLKIVWVAAATI